MSTDQRTPSEIYNENNRLREKLGRAQWPNVDEQDSPDLPQNVAHATEDIEMDSDLEMEPLRDCKRTAKNASRRDVRSQFCSLWKWRNYIIFVLIWIPVTAMTLAYLWDSVKSREAAYVSSGTAAAQKTMQLLRDVVPDTVDLNVGMRQDYLIQDCVKNNLKQTFPDFEYSLLGYNILRGYPLATGHDPGFTYPIFAADYSTKAQTADCRYSIPHGFIVVPDVSCMTSFSSKTIQSSHEFSKELSVSAHVSGGGWGVSFSASAGYKESSSEVSSGESVLIISTAECNYYFSKLLPDDAPEFHHVFVDWIYKLNASLSGDTTTVFFNFLDLYGTHYPTMLTYGARYTYQHKMSSSKYKSERSKGVNVAVQAGYSGIVSVSGGFSLDSSQREAASSFSKNVETKTFTVGAAPPANGDAMTWASEVKTSPVPTKYELSMISELFTDRYMADLGVDLDNIRETLGEIIPEYCTFLKRKGQVETCQAVKEGIFLKDTRLIDHYKSLDVESENICLDQCIDERGCVSITFCLDCRNMHKCYFFEESNTAAARKEGNSDGDSTWVTTILPSKIQDTHKFDKTAIEGVERSDNLSSETRLTIEECKKQCLIDEQCMAFSYCQCPSKLRNCFMYSISFISGLKEDNDYMSFFIGNEIKSSFKTASETTTSTTTSTTSTTSTKSVKVRSRNIFQ